MTPSTTPQPSPSAQELRHEAKHQRDLAEASLRDYKPAFLLAAKACERRIRPTRSGKGGGR